MHLGTLEIVVVVVLLIVLYGKRLPEITRIIGRSITTFKKTINEVKEEVQKEIDGNSKESSKNCRSNSVSETRVIQKEADRLEKLADNNKHDLAG